MAMYSLYIHTWVIKDGVVVVVCVLGHVLPVHKYMDYQGGGGGGGRCTWPCTPCTVYINIWVTKEGVVVVVGVLGHIQYSLYIHTWVTKEGVVVVEGVLGHALPVHKYMGYQEGGGGDGMCTWPCTPRT